MAKRKPDASLAGQLDMFGGLSSAPNELLSNLVPIGSKPPPPQIEVANDQLVAPIHMESEATSMQDGEIEAFSAPDEAVAHTPSTTAIKPVNGWENDEWWTTAMVCAYLKLGRKAIWERTRNPTIGFPQPTHFGSCRHRWRAGEVKAWAQGS
jgi:predicted DNA-binding transcriptional regulator AlpA